jgi:phosphoribosylformimino-5-aminoimidazole carboxamide ribotide isomerase
VYVADLDAIEAQGDNGVALARLKAEYPDVGLWVDNGIADAVAATRWLDRRLGHLVLGSESQSDLSLLHRFARDDRVVLSLDFRGAALQGPAQLLGDVSAWPDRIIVMTLARVGSGAGPDIERLSEVRALAPQRRIYAAGGVRDADDLAALARAGIAGALVATSLHDGRLGRADIDKLAADPAASPR